MNQQIQRPFSIKIFVPDGDPDGLRLVEKSNWTGIGVVFNRSLYKEVSQRPEFTKTGVYVLIGSSEGSALPTIYIGEGDLDGTLKGWATRSPSYSNAKDNNMVETK